MLENAYQAQLRKRIEKRFPGCFIMKNDSGLLQGIPDLILLWGPHWAMLEVKASKPSPADFEPNQEWYVSFFNDMSYGACIYPENEEEILNEIQRSFAP